MAKERELAALSAKNKNGKHFCGALLLLCIKLQFKCTTKCAIKCLTIFTPDPPPDVPRSLVPQLSGATIYRDAPAHQRKWNLRAQTDFIQQENAKLINFPALSLSQILLRPNSKSQIVFLLSGNSLRTLAK